MQKTTNMKTRKFIIPNSIHISSTNSTNQNCSVIIDTGCNEYTLPEFPGTTVREIFNSSNVEDILKYAFPKYKTKTIDKLKARVLKETLADYCQKDTNGATPPLALDNDSPNLYWITFWGVDLESCIISYLDNLENEVANAIDTASGDDSYYDYMRSFLDCYRQICELFGLKTRYNKFIVPYLLQERHSDNNFYHTMI